MAIETAKDVAYEGQLAFMMAKRSVSIARRRIAENRASWVEFGEVFFASTPHGSMAVGIVDVKGEIEKNPRGGEESSIRGSLLRKFNAQFGDVSVADVRVVSLTVTFK